MLQNVTEWNVTDCIYRTTAYIKPIFLDYIIFGVLYR